MTTSEKIRSRLKEMASEVGPQFSMLAQVKSVDEAGMTCDLYDDESGLDFFDVRLRPVLDGRQSLTLVPKIDSWVLAIRIEDSDDWMIVACGEFQKVMLTCDEIIINGGNNGGLVNWPDVKSELDKTNQVVNALVQSLTGWTPTPNDGGAALKLYASGQLAGKAVGNYSGKEDTKVKH